jgi:hypothetical protein
MRSVTAISAVLLMAATPVFAQGPTITGPRKLTTHQISCTDLPIETMVPPAMVIKGGHNTDGHQAFVKGDVIVIGRTPADGLAVGQRFAARRVQSALQGFDQKGEAQRYPIAVRTAGWVTVTAVDDLNALATVDFSCDALDQGDFLVPHVDATLPVAAEPMNEPQFADRAEVLVGNDRRGIFGDGDTFSIDRGTIHGVVQGARFAIYRDRKDGIPLVYVGDTVVVDTSETISKVVLVLMKDVVHVGDIAVRRRNP